MNWMKDLRNEDPEQKEDTAQDPTEDNLKKDEALGLDLSKERLSKEDSELPREGGNFIVKWNLRVRALLRSLLLGNSLATRIFWLVVINSLAAALLAASVIHAYKSGSSDIEWCDGVGFLWILYCLVYIYVFFHLISKYAGPSIRRCLRPALSRLSTLGDIMLFRFIAYCIPVVVLLMYVILWPGKSGRRKFSFMGMVVFIVLGYLFSKYPGHVNWRPVVCGMVLQFLFGILTMQVETGRDVLDCLGRKVSAFLDYTKAGTAFCFGYLAEGNEDNPGVFAFSVLPVIYFLSFFINILSYYGALQWFIMGVSKFVRLVMGTTVCESVNAAASIFLGMTEAPLLILKYLKYLTKSEVCALVCAGWSTVAGSVMAAYIQFGIKASHLIAASFMSAPASLAYSKLLYPETKKSRTTVENIVLEKEEASNFLDAASKGALSAILVVTSIIANIIAFLAFIALIDGLLLWIGSITGFEQLSFQFVASTIFYPISFLLGVDVDSLEDVAYLIGVKTVVNEFDAYQKLGELIKANKISERSEIIATYALCGFSNFGSIGITIGTLSVMEPKQASVVSEVALRAFIAANVVCFLTACVAGCLID